MNLTEVEVKDRRAGRGAPRNQHDGDDLTQEEEEDFSFLINRRDFLTAGLNQV